MKFRIKRALALAGGTAAAATLLTAMPAQAADSVGASGTGVRATGSITWTKSTRADPVTFRVYDTACDNKGVYAQFTVTYPGGSWRTEKRTNYNGCGTDQSWNSYINDARRIIGVTLRACTDDDKCYTDYVPNPYY